MPIPVRFLQKLKFRCRFRFFSFLVMIQNSVLLLTVISFFKCFLIYLCLIENYLLDYNIERQCRNDLSFMQCSWSSKYIKNRFTSIVGFQYNGYPAEAIHKSIGLFSIFYNPLKIIIELYDIKINKRFPDNSIACITSNIIIISRNDLKTL